ncbi:MAG: MGDG synthase family glycosyltransferase [Candidatus Tyrphobacter sp.]
MTRVLFLSASVGDGHSSAANAVREALDEIDPKSSALTVDSYRYAALVVSGVVSSGYIQMVKTIPQMYRFLYHRAERATEVGPFRTWAHQFTAGNLRALIDRERPDVVVCTHAFPCGAMAEYKAAYAGAPPVMGIVTDFAVHGFWAHENVDAYAVATEALRSDLAARGIDARRIAVTGIPVHPGFWRHPEPKAAVRRRLGLPVEGSIVLVMGGGLGIGPLERMLCAVDDVRGCAAIVAIAGRNAKVERRAQAVACRLRSRIYALGFIENVYDYMRACDVLVTKPGGLTAAEALAAGIPMVLCRPLPGQEERNSRILVEAGSAIRVRAVKELPAALDMVLSDPDRRARMVSAAATLGRPRAAEEIARLIGQMAQADEAVA